MNSLDETNQTMNLGGGEDKQGDQEPEQEKGSVDNTENSAWAGINQFAAIAQDWKDGQTLHGDSGDSMY